MPASVPSARRPELARTSLRSLPAALGGYLLSLVLSATCLAIALGLGATESGLSATIAGQLGLWCGFIGVPLLLSAVGGTNSLARDFGLVFRWKDLWGIPLGAATQFVLVPLVSLPIRLFKSDDDLSAPAREVMDRASGWGRIVLAALVVLCAPVAEELFFRGLLQKAALSHLRTPLAVGGVALFFGLTHFQPLLLPPLVAAGLVFGIAAYRCDRLGLAVVTHAAFNASTVTVLLLFD